MALPKDRLPKHELPLHSISWAPQLPESHGERVLFPGLSGTSVWRPQSCYTVSRIECRIKFLQNQRCHAKIALHPPKSRCRTFLQTPLSHFPLICSRQGAQQAGGGYRGTFGFRKRIALQGGIAATVTPVALLCATKFLVCGICGGFFGEISCGHVSCWMMMDEFRE